MAQPQDLENELENLAEEALAKEAAESSGTSAAANSSPASETDGDASESALSADLEALVAEISKLKDTAARSQADYVNLVARTERERNEMADYVTEKLVVKLLPSFDNLDRVLSGTHESERSGALYQGVSSTLSGLKKTLESIGVTEFASAGEPLDPELHEAVAKVPGEEGRVVFEFEKGYRFRNKVIRHAKVTVGDGNGTEGTA